ALREVAQRERLVVVEAKRLGAAGQRIDEVARARQQGGALGVEAQIVAGEHRRLDLADRGGRGQREIAGARLQRRAAGQRQRAGPARQVDVAAVRADLAGHVEPGVGGEVDGAAVGLDVALHQHGAGVAQRDGARVGGA
ncbi:hypothetical protein D0817_25315, partial [Flavobacterium cupreum]